MTFRTGQAVLINFEISNHKLIVDGETIHIKGRKIDGPATILYPYKEEARWSVI